MASVMHDMRRCRRFQVVTLMPYTRRVVMGSLVQGGSTDSMRSGVSVLLSAAGSINSQYSAQDPDNLATALQVIDVEDICRLNTHKALRHMRTRC